MQKPETKNLRVFKFYDIEVFLFINIIKKYNKIIIIYL